MSAGLRVVVVGAGWVAERHAQAIARAGDRVAAVVEPAAERRVRLAGQLGCEAAASLPEWLPRAAGVNAAVVASPSAHHLSQATDLVRAGVAVLVEKPHRLPGQSAQELVDEAARRAIPVQVGMTTRFALGMLRLREILAEERLGRVAWVADRIWLRLVEGQIPDWYFDHRASGGGVLLTNGVHALDRVAWLLGEPLDLVHADLQTLASGRAVEDAAALRLSSPSAVTVDVSLLWTPYSVPESELCVVGSDGTAVVRGDGSWWISAADGRSLHGDREDEQARFDRQWSAFRRTVLDGTEPDPSVEAVERTLLTIEAAYSREAVA